MITARYTAGCKRVTLFHESPIIYDLAVTHSKHIVCLTGLAFPQSLTGPCFCTPLVEQRRS